MRISSKKIRQAILVTEGTVQDDPLPEYMAFFKEDGSQVTLESLVGPAGPQGLVWRGTWDSARAYDPQDAVEYNGEGYITLKPVAAGGSTPDTLYGPFPGTEIPTQPLSEGTTPSTLSTDDHNDSGVFYSEYYRFVVEFGGTLSIRYRVHNHYDAELWVHNAVGGLVGHNDDSTWAADTYPGSTAYDSRVDLDLTPGTYFVRAGNHSAIAGGSGAYDIDLVLGTAVLGEDGATWQKFVEKGATVGIPGPEGEKGDKGDKGDTGDPGPPGEDGVDGIGIGIPAGGAVGRKLAKASAADYDVAWVPDTSSLPAGGATGKILGKISGADYDVGWVDQAAGGGGSSGPSYKGDWNIVTNYAAGDVVKYGAALWEAQSAIAAGITPSVTGATVYKGGNAIDGTTAGLTGGADTETAFTVNADVTVSEVEFLAAGTGIPANTTVQIRNGARTTVLATGTVGATAAGVWGKAVLVAPVLLQAGNTYTVKILTGQVSYKNDPEVPNGVVSAVGSMYTSGNTYPQYSNNFKINGLVANPWSKMIAEGGPKYKGDFSAAVAYSAGDLVKSASGLWEAKVAVAASATVPAEGANWTKLVTDGGAGGPKFKGDYSAVTSFLAGDLVRYAGAIWEAQSAPVAGTAPSTSLSTILQGGNHVAGGTNVNFGGGNNEQAFTVNATTVISALEIQLYNGGLAAGAVGEIRNAARDTVLATGVFTAGAGGDWIRCAFNATVTLVAGTTYVLRAFTGNAGAKANPAVPNGIVSALGTAYANGGAQGAFSLAFKLYGPVANPWSKIVGEAGWNFMELFDVDLSAYTDISNKSALSISSGKMTHAASTIATGAIVRRAGLALTDLVQVIKVNVPTVASGDLNVNLLARISGDNLSWLQCGVNMSGTGTAQLQMYKNVAGTFTLLTGNAGIGSVLANTDYWIVQRLVGKVFKVEWWASDPRAGGSPATTNSYTLSDAELAAFNGTGVGIRMFAAAGAKYDEHGARSIDANLVF